MEHVFSVWQGVVERIRAADQILLLTDFDGTLSPIVRKPEEASLPEGTRRAIESLAAHERVSVAVVSGRALADIKNRVGIDGITYAGNHGIEIEGPWLKFVYPPAEALRPAIRQVHSSLVSALSGFDGVFVEDKGITLSIHYRLLAEEKVGELKRTCEETVRALRAGGKIRTTEGKKVYEIRPGVLWDKEDAIVLLLTGWMSSTRKNHGLCFFLGDDRTDEEGFKVMNGHGGTSIFVGESGSVTAARYFLRSPAEVEEFLNRLTEAI